MIEITQWLITHYASMLVVFLHLNIVLIALFVFYRHKTVEKSAIEHLCHMTVISEDLHNGREWLRSHKTIVLTAYCMLLVMGLGSVYYASTSDMTVMDTLNHSIIEGSWWFVFGVLGFFCLLGLYAVQMLSPAYWNYLKYQVFGKEIPDTYPGYLELVAYIHKGLNCKTQENGTKFHELNWGLKRSAYFTTKDSNINYLYGLIKARNLRNKVAYTLPSLLIWTIFVYSFLHIMEH
jgi:hypothetical protein